MMVSLEVACNTLQVSSFMPAYPQRFSMGSAGEGDSEDLRTADGGSLAPLSANFEKLLDNIRCTAIIGQ